jgi:zinc transport system ATP-binding protein
MSETPPEPIIQVRQLCFRYREREVLHQVDFTIGSRDMVAIVGPNGGGKTTLLQLILGLLKPSLGEVLLFGEEPARTRSRVGYVPQQLRDDRQFPICANEVVAIGLLGDPSPSGNARKRIREALERTGAGALANRPFGQLSGGERQRVLLSSALVSQPDLLVMDEPTANVDPKSAHELHEFFKELNREIPILLVSHHLSVVSRHVSHVLCVNRTAALHPIGEILQSTFTERYGGELAVIGHGPGCHVSDPSRAMADAHWQEPTCACGHKGNKTTP